MNYVGARTGGEVHAMDARTGSVDWRGPITNTSKRSTGERPASSEVYADRSQVVRFFALALGISWSFWLPMALFTGANQLLLVLGTFGPTVAAVILVLWSGGVSELRTLLSRLLIWRVAPRWYLIIFAGPAVVALVSIWGHVLLGGTWPEFNDPRQLYLVIPVFFYVLIFSVAGEETGWRGYALPRLLARFSLLRASLLLGVVWAVWHLPLFWTAGDIHRDLPLSLFFAQILGFSILYTWLWVRTGGSLLIAHLFHAASNTAIGVLPILPESTGGDLLPLWLAVGVLWIAALGVVLVNARQWLASPAVGGTASGGRR